MRSLKNDKDVAQTTKAGEGGSLDFVKLDAKVNFVAIVSPDYSDGFVHYLRKNGKVKSIPCKAGLDGRGFAPDDCPLCRQALDNYNASKEASDAGEKKLLKEAGNGVRAQYKLYLFVLKGEALLTKDAKTGKKTYKPDFDDAKAVQVLGCTEHQKKLILSLIDNPDTDIKSGEDLVGKVLRIEREDDGQKKVSSITVEGELDLSEVDISELPDLDSILFNTPEDYEAAIADFMGDKDGATKERETDEREFKVGKTKPAPTTGKVLSTKKK